MLTRRILIILVTLAASLLFCGAAFASSYTIQPGDTLWKVAQKNGTTVQAIMGANSIPNPNRVYPGQRIEIPSPGNNANSGATTADIDLMARVVTAEAGGEPYIGQVGVAAVILNRLEDSRFPKTIPGVVYQPFQFEVVGIGSLWWFEPTATAKKAIQDALNGSDPTGGALYFGTAASRFIWTRPITTKIGNHYFSI